MRWTFGEQAIEDGALTFPAVDSDQDLDASGEALCVHRADRLRQ
jgi:hypothetical protein